MLNNPINANDPSGHLCVGEPEGCLKDDGTTGSGFTGTGGSTSGNNSVGDEGGGGGDNSGSDSGGGGGGSTFGSVGRAGGTICDGICQPKKLYDQYVLGYQYTPIATSSIQFITGTWMLWMEAAMAVPQLTPIAAPLYFLSYAENRAASFVGWQAVDYQYDNGLYGVTELDTYISGGSLIAGSIWPPLSPYVSDINFIWDITHTNWQDFP